MTLLKIAGFYNLLFLFIIAAGNPGTNERKRIYSTYFQIPYRDWRHIHFLHLFIDRAASERSLMFVHRSFIQFISPEERVT